jgi:Ca-activated chloride channel family protein
MISRVITLAFALASLLLHSSAQSPSPAKSVGEVEPDVISISTRLVTVPATVRRRDGGYVTGLRREDFRIYEDGVEQQVTHFESVNQPIYIVLMIDYSVSVRADLPDVRGIAADFLDQLRPGDRVRAVAFGNDVIVLTGDGHDRPSLRKAILAAPMQGGTALYDAVFFTFRHLIDRGGARKAVILFTDGVDTASHRGSYEKGLAYAGEVDAPAHVVEYGKLPPEETERERQGSLYLRELARKSGGQFYFAGGREGMAKSLRSIAEELRAQYSLGYYPPATEKRGKRLKIKVRVNRPDAAVRARDSYTIGSGDRR